MDTITFPKPPEPKRPGVTLDRDTYWRLFRATEKAHRHLMWMRHNGTLGDEIDDGSARHLITELSALADFLGIDTEGGTR